MLALCRPYQKFEFSSIVTFSTGGPNPPDQILAQTRTGALSKHQMATRVTRRSDPDRGAGPRPGLLVSGHSAAIDAKPRDRETRQRRARHGHARR